jgi:hypothetical protein
LVWPYSWLPYLQYSLEQKDHHVGLVILHSVSIFESLFKCWNRTFLHLPQYYLFSKWITVLGLSKPGCSVSHWFICAKLLWTVHVLPMQFYGWWNPNPNLQK